jgi:hypothetical protein
LAALVLVLLWQPAITVAELKPQQNIIAVLVDDSQGPHWAERLLARSLELPVERLPDYPGSAIGWEDHLLHASAFDVELPSRLSRATIRRVASAIRLVAQRDLLARIEGAPHQPLTRGQ